MNGSPTVGFGHFDHSERKDAIIVNCQLSIVNSVKPLNNNLPLRRVGPMAAVYKNKYTIPESGLSTHFPVRRTLAFAGGTCYNRFIYF